MGSEVLRSNYLQCFIYLAIYLDAIITHCRWQMNKTLVQSNGEKY